MSSLLFTSIQAKSLAETIVQCNLHLQELQNAMRVLGMNKAELKISAIQTTLEVVARKVEDLEALASENLT